MCIAAATASHVCDGDVVKRCLLPVEEQKSVTLLHTHFREADLYSAYEAGFSGFVLHRVLCANGIRNRVVHAASIDVSSRDRVKTDKRDSMKIAVQLAAGRLTGIRVPAEAEELRRLLTRTRDQLIRSRTRMKNRIRMKLHQFGILDGGYSDRSALHFLTGV